MSESSFTTPLGTYEYGFSLFFNPSVADQNDLLNIEITENVVSQRYKFYSDKEFKNEIGYGFWSGSVNSFINPIRIVDSGILVIDLEKLGTITTTYSFINKSTVRRPYVLIEDLLNNSIVTGGTGNFKYSMGSIISSNNYGPRLCELIFYNLVK